MKVYEYIKRDWELGELRFLLMSEYIEKLLQQVLDVQTEILSEAFKMQNSPSKREEYNKNFFYFDYFTVKEICVIEIVMYHGRSVLDDTAKKFTDIHELLACYWDYLRFEGATIIKKNQEINTILSKTNIIGDCFQKGFDSITDILEMS
jgi:hypothetical protein